jgi:hypothetical protein
LVAEGGSKLYREYEVETRLPGGSLFLFETKYMLHETILYVPYRIADL